MKEKNIKDIKKYVKKELKKSNCEIGVFKKNIRVKARQGKLGEVVETFMKDGTLKKIGKVGFDLTSRNNDWIITNSDGEKDIIKDYKFDKEYEEDPQNPGLYKSKDKPIIAIKIDENICFDDLWGKKIHTEKDGYLNITDPYNIYGIQNEEFKNTYVCLSDKNTDELKETFTEFYDLVILSSTISSISFLNNKDTGLREGLRELHKIVDEIINNYETLDNIEYNEPFRLKIQDNDKTLDEIINETSKSTVLGKEKSINKIKNKDNFDFEL